MNYESSVEAKMEESYSKDLARGDLSGRSRGGRGWLPWVIAIALLLAVLAGAAYFFGGGSGEEAGAGAAADQSEQLPVVSVITPGKATLEGELVASGALAARRAMPVGVAGEGGRIVSIPVDAGDWVRAGQVLAVIDRSVQSQQIASAAAQLEVGRADADLAQSNLDRASKLIERGFISKADIDRLTATRDAARARVKVSRAQLSELRARTARLNVVAPAAGLLLERRAEPGQVVSAGSGALFTIAKGGEIEMLAEVGEAELAQLSTGVSAEINPVGSEKIFTGQVWQIAPTINANNRQGTARIALSYAPELRPGGYATAKIKSGTITAPLLPESAVLSDDDGSYVFIIGKENKAQRRVVKTGNITDSGVIISEGLDGSEMIVLRAGGFLTEGESVKPNKVESAEG